MMRWGVHLGKLWAVLHGYALVLRCLLPWHPAACAGRNVLQWTIHLWNAARRQWVVGWDAGQGSHTWMQQPG